MTRYQCIREILDSFDFYDERAAHLDAWTWDGQYHQETAQRDFRTQLYGVVASRDITATKPGEKHESRRAIFQRVYRAYVFKGVREGHEAGLDYLSICYAFCKRIAATGEDQCWERFSMHTWACLKTGEPLHINVQESIGDPEKVSLKKKLAFLRAERLKRKTYKELNREPPQHACQCEGRTVRNMV